MRLFLIAFSIAFILLLPSIAEQYDFHLPLVFLISIPAIGLSYTAILFHEIGHTVASWIYGYPAFPSFDFQHGGGMTYSGGRHIAIVWLLYAAAMGAGAWLYRAQTWFALAILSVVVTMHLATAFNASHDIVIAFMGHGTEILVSCFFILRGLHGDRHGIAERGISLVFGLFTLGRNILFCFSLFDDIGRMAYDMQKGGHILGDLAKIAQDSGMRIEAVSICTLLFMGISCAITLLLYRHIRQQES